jgi:hypothetical protein
MAPRQKLGVIAVFAFGNASVILRCIRSYALMKLISLNKTAHGVGEIIIVAALKLNVAAFALNLPAMRSTWVKYFKDKKSQTQPSSASGVISRS